ncbi:MAG: hypothetical protein AAB681_00605, partial [Patescibacteria group bacterium]
MTIEGYHPNNTNELENNPNETIVSLESQEKVDEQIKIEADRLKVNIETLQQEIENLGGAEKVKEFLDKPANPIRTEGEDVVHVEKNKAELKNSFKKIAAIVGAVFTGLAVFAAKEDPHLIERMKDFTFSDPGVQMETLMSLVGTSSLIGGIYSAITEKIADRKAKREYIK